MPGTHFLNKLYMKSNYISWKSQSWIKPTLPSRSALCSWKSNCIYSLCSTQAGSESSLCLEWSKKASWEHHLNMRNEGKLCRQGRGRMFGWEMYRVEKCGEQCWGWKAESAGKRCSACVSLDHAQSWIRQASSRLFLLWVDTYAAFPQHLAFCDLHTWLTWRTPSRRKITQHIQTFLQVTSWNKASVTKSTNCMGEVAVDRAE